MERIIADQSKLTVQLEVEGQSDLAELAQQHLERMQANPHGPRKHASR